MNEPVVQDSQYNLTALITESKNIDIWLRPSVYGNLDHIFSMQHTELFSGVLLLFTTFMLML